MIYNKDIERQGHNINTERIKIMNNKIPSVAEIIEDTKRIIERCYVTGRMDTVYALTVQVENLEKIMNKGS
jgi:hypothetical protein